MGMRLRALSARGLSVNHIGIVVGGGDARPVPTRGVGTSRTATPSATRSNRPTALAWLSVNHNAPSGP